MLDYKYICYCLVDWYKLDIDILLEYEKFKLVPFYKHQLAIFPNYDIEPKYRIFMSKPFYIYNNNDGDDWTIGVTKKHIKTMFKYILYNMLLEYSGNIDIRSELILNKFGNDSYLIKISNNRHLINSDEIINGINSIEENIKLIIK